MGFECLIGKFTWLSASYKCESPKKVKQNPLQNLQIQEVYCSRRQALWAKLLLVFSRQILLEYKKTKKDKDVP